MSVPCFRAISRNVGLFCLTHVSPWRVNKRGGKRVYALDSDNFDGISIVEIQLVLWPPLIEWMRARISSAYDP